MNERRINRDGDYFYEALKQYYQEGSEAHSSPVRRLIQQKNTAFEHKKTMTTSIDKGDYALTYTPGPGKSYVIEPHGGQLNYRLAEKNPLKFMDEVLAGDVTKHTVAKDKEALRKNEEEQKQRAAEGKRPLKKQKVETVVKSKVTKRPHLKMMDKIIFKIAERLQQKIGQELGLATLMNVMKDRNVQEQINELIKQDKIAIVDQANNLLFEKEIGGLKRQATQTHNKQERSAKKGNVTPSIKDDASSKSSQQQVEVEDVDGDARGGATMKHGALVQEGTLKIAEQDLKKIQYKVLEVHRRNSYR